MSIKLLLSTTISAVYIALAVVFISFQTMSTANAAVSYNERQAITSASEEYKVDDAGVTYSEVSVFAMTVFWSAIGTDADIYSFFRKGNVIGLEAWGWVDDGPAPIAEVHADGYIRDKLPLDWDMIFYITEDDEPYIMAINEGNGIVRLFEYGDK